MITEISRDAHKVLKRWAKSQFYVYLRPLSSLFIDPNKKAKIYWTVTVEYRNPGPKQQWRAEGYDLSALILEVDAEVPRRNTEGLEYKPQRWNGAYSPEKVRKAEQKKASTKKKKAKR